MIEVNATFRWFVLIMYVASIFHSLSPTVLNCFYFMTSFARILNDDFILNDENEML